MEKRDGGVDEQRVSISVCASASASAEQEPDEAVRGLVEEGTGHDVQKLPAAVEHYLRTNGDKPHNQSAKEKILNHVAPSSTHRRLFLSAPRSDGLPHTLLFAPNPSNCLHFLLFDFCFYRFPCLILSHALALATVTSIHNNFFPCFIYVSISFLFFYT